MTYCDQTVNNITENVTDRLNLQNRRRSPTEIVAPGSAESGEDRAAPRPSAQTDGGQAAAGQRSAGRGRGEAQEGEGIRE